LIHDEKKGTSSFSTSSAFPPSSASSTTKTPSLFSASHSFIPSKTLTSFPSSSSQQKQPPSSLFKQSTSSLPLFSPHKEDERKDTLLKGQTGVPFTSPSFTTTMGSMGSTMNLGNRFRSPFDMSSAATPQKPLLSGSGNGEMQTPFKSPLPNVNDTSMMMSSLGDGIASGMKNTMTLNELSAIPGEKKPVTMNSSQQQQQASMIDLSEKDQELCFSLLDAQDEMIQQYKQKVESLERKLHSFQERNNNFSL
jgi:hypothetical protein